MDDGEGTVLLLVQPPGLVKLTSCDKNAANATNETIEAEAQRGRQK